MSNKDSNDKTSPMSISDRRAQRDAAQVKDGLEKKQKRIAAQEQEEKERIAVQKQEEKERIAVQKKNEAYEKAANKSFYLERRKKRDDLEAKYALEAKQERVAVQKQEQEEKKKAQKAQTYSEQETANRKWNAINSVETDFDKQKPDENSHSTSNRKTIQANEGAQTADRESRRNEETRKPDRDDRGNFKKEASRLASKTRDKVTKGAKSAYTTFNKNLPSAKGRNNDKNQDRGR